MHPGLRSWRTELPDSFVRLLSYLSAIVLLSIAAAHFFQSPKPIRPITRVDQSSWIEIERPFPAFALSIPEAANVAATYAIRRHADGGGRKDILELGDADSTEPYLHVEIYRPGTEIRSFADPEAEIIDVAAAIGPVELRRAEQDLATKFGPLPVFYFSASKGTPRQCLAYVRAFDDPRLQLAGWFCQGGSEFIHQSTLACALDRLTLLAAGSEPKVGTLFAQAERNRSYCGQRDPILAATPKYHLLWKALASRPQPRRLGR
ncbi:MAG TPA: hypothetical protein VH558_18820 [Pseudolabrys sp.]